jgi:putative oxidoreductase
MFDLQTTARRRTARVSVTLLRLAVGGIFMAHAWEKLSDMTGTIASFARVGVPYPVGTAYLATAGELVGGVGLVLGIWTPAAALAPILTTIFAIYFLNGESGFYAGSGGWEYPFILLLVCVYFATHGSGPYSMDAALGRQAPQFRRRHRHVVSG